MSTSPDPYPLCIQPMLQFHCTYDTWGARNVPAQSFVGWRPSQVVDEVIRTGRPAIVTRHGRPVTAMVAIDPDQLEDYVLAGGATNLDAMPLAGVPPWHRLRVGDYRILYRAVDPGEAVDTDARWLVARVVHRRALERAVSTLA